MEITLEKIELVKDRTGVSYKEAKDALEAAGGSVVDAIIAIEETIDEKPAKKVNEAANETVDKIKELVKKGNISKITIKKDDEVLLNLPLNAGLVGALVAPWGVIAGLIAAFGFKCQIELLKDDGTIIDISQRAEEIGKEVKEKSSVVVDDVMAKSAEAYSNIVEAATDKIAELKAKKDDFEIEVEMVMGDLEGKLEDLADQAEAKIDEIAEAAEEILGGTEAAADAAEEKTEE